MTNAGLDLVGDVRNHLHRLRQVLAATFLLNDAQVHLPGGHVVAAPQINVQEAFVIAQVEVGFRAVGGDEDLAVLVRPHGSGVQVDVRVNLDGHHTVATRPQQRADAGGGNALAE